MDHGMHHEARWHLPVRPIIPDTLPIRCQDDRVKYEHGLLRDEHGLAEDNRGLVTDEHRLVKDEHAAILNASVQPTTPSCSRYPSHKRLLPHLTTLPFSLLPALPALPALPSPSPALPSLLPVCLAPRPPPSARHVSHPTLLPLIACSTLHAPAHIAIQHCYPPQSACQLHVCQSLPQSCPSSPCASEKTSSQSHSTRTRSASSSGPSTLSSTLLPSRPRCASLHPLTAPSTTSVAAASRSFPCSVVPNVGLLIFSSTVTSLTYPSVGTNPAPGPAVGSHNTASNTSDGTQPARVLLPIHKDQPSPIDLNALDTLPALSLHDTGSSLLQLTNAAVFDGESEPIMATHNSLAAALHTSKSSPGFSRQLAAKLSSALLQPPTVIHRPKRRSRPTVLSSRKNRDGRDEDKSSSESTSPPSAPAQSSSPVDSGNAVLSQSTAPTSLGSSNPRLSAETARRLQSPSLQKPNIVPSVRDVGSKQLTTRWLHFPSQDTPRLSTPSIVTVENAAAAKIFFETHFNQLLGPRMTPRSVRRRRLESKLFALALSYEQRHQRRQAWQTAETHHLRQTRVTKSKTLIRRDTKGVHISNYDIVRVLGKGSFGVVRLVREKSTHSECTYDHEPSHDACSVQLTSKRPSRARKPKQVYAMKVIRKSDMLRNSQEGHLRAERDFLVASENSKWVVPLIASFQDNNNLYLVMEYMVGGDFLGLLLREDVLDESVAK
jgi:hypothetical protein